MTVGDGHAIGHAVKDRLVSSFVNVKNVLVHIEPSPERAEQFSTKADAPVCK
jgi:divalent metal cation (Fe/Co/Zn/Cd) transporter